MGKAGKERKKRKLASADINESVTLEDHSLISAANVLDFFVRNPDLLKGSKCKKLKTALFSLNFALQANSLSVQITNLLANGRFVDAHRLLLNLLFTPNNTSVHAPKLGSLQRWVRYCDAASTNGKEHNANVLRCLDIILRLASQDPCSELFSKDSNEYPLHYLPEWSCTNLSIDNPEESIYETSNHYKNCFTVVLHQKGSERLTPNKHDLIIHHSNYETIHLDPLWKPDPVVEIPNVPGGICIPGVLSKLECRQIISAAESVGYVGDCPLAGEASQQTSVLAHNFFWLADSKLLSGIFDRVKEFLPPQIDGLGLAGINSRWRLYRYVPGAVYRPHIDGAWPCSGLDADGNYQYDIAGNQRSRLTFLVYLNDNFEGGQTTFFTPSSKFGVMNAQGVKPVTGAVVCFPHGDLKGSILHEGSAVLKGTKYIIRTDVLYYLPEKDWSITKQEFE